MRTQTTNPKNNSSSKGNGGTQLRDPGQFEEQNQRSNTMCYGHPELMQQQAEIMKPATLTEIFGEPIHTYTRAQAIEDGYLVDFTDPESDTAGVCRQHYKHPIACTLSVFEIMQKAVENKRYCQDYAGILHDMLFMSKATGRKIDESTVLFTVIIQGAGRQKYHQFKLQVHPGDQGEPVITISLPGED